MYKHSGWLNPDRIPSKAAIRRHQKERRNHYSDTVIFYPIDGGFYPYESGGAGGGGDCDGGGGDGGGGDGGGGEGGGSEGGGDGGGGDGVPFSQYPKVFPIFSFS